MSGEHPDTVKVEEGIYRRPGGTYSVRVYKNYTGYRASFPTLAKARRFRNQIRSLKVPQEENQRVSLEKARKQAKTVIRDGREYKLVNL